MIDVNVKNNKVFQDLVLLVDRDDFLSDCKLLKTFLGIKLLAGSDKLEGYGNASQEIYLRISELREKYKYPQELENAINAAILNNQITEIDIIRYKPFKYERSKVIRNYLHPILSLRPEPTIRRDRELYWLNKNMGYSRIKNSREYKKYTHNEDNLSTIQSAINSYKRKLAIIL